jgi:hypothetical protein
VLLEVAQRLRERPVLVTFNGGAFDWPLLEMRFRMTRAIAPPPLAAHLDLLQPARRLWRLQLGSVRLPELERYVLGGDTLAWSRRDDMDASLIPQIYFDYLRGGPAEPLAGVFLHNRMDLRGTAALAERVLRTLSEPEEIPDSPESAAELYCVSRMLAQRGECARARALCQRALAAGLPPRIDRLARHDLARMARREGDFTTASLLWNELAHGTRPSFEACEQLAIYHERCAGDATAALRVVRRALARLRGSRSTERIESRRHAFWLARFEQRLARLARRAGVRLTAPAARIPDGCGPA